MRNNVKFFCTPEHFIRLTIGTVNNIIEIGYLDYGIQSDTDIAKNTVYCSFRGEDLEQITVADLDILGNEDKFAYETLTGSNKNIIKIAVDKSFINTPDKAKKYITGLLIDYLLEDLTYANSAQNPLYYFKACLSDGTIISISEACTRDVFQKKMDALDKDAAINSIGFNEYYIRRATIKRS